MKTQIFRFQRLLPKSETTAEIRQPTAEFAIHKNQEKGVPVDRKMLSTSGSYGKTIDTEQ